MGATFTFRQIKPVVCWFDLEKGIQHKYIRKYRNGGRWVYVYPDKKGDRHGKEASVSAKKAVGTADDIHVGASYSAGAFQGHAIVDSIDKDGAVTFHIDDIDGKGTPGKPIKASKSEFLEYVSGSHKDAFERHAKEGHEKRKAILETARKHGTEKHIARAEKELSRWEEMHGTGKKEPKKEAPKPAEAAPAPEKPAKAKKEKQGRAEGNSPYSPPPPSDSPALEGSSKQIKSASAIREKASSDMRGWAKSAAKSGWGKHNKEAMDTIIKEAEAQTDAQWWASNENELKGKFLSGYDQNGPTFLPDSEVSDADRIREVMNVLPADSQARVRAATKTAKAEAKERADTAPAPDKAKKEKQAKAKTETPAPSSPPLLGSDAQVTQAATIRERAASLLDNWGALASKGGSDEYKASAKSIVEAAMAQQNASWWIKNENLLSRDVGVSAMTASQKKKEARRRMVSALEALPSGDAFRIRKGFVDAQRAKASKAKADVDAKRKGGPLEGVDTSEKLSSLRAGKGRSEMGEIVGNLAKEQGVLSSRAVHVYDSIPWGKHSYISSDNTTKFWMHQGGDGEMSLSHQAPDKYSEVRSLGKFELDSNWTLDELVENTKKIYDKARAKADSLDGVAKEKTKAEAKDRAEPKVEPKGQTLDELMENVPRIPTDVYEAFQEEVGKTNPAPKKEKEKPKAPEKPKKAERTDGSTTERALVNQIIDAKEVGDHGAGAKHFDKLVEELRPTHSNLRKQLSVLNEKEDELTAKYGAEKAKAFAGEFKAMRSSINSKLESLEAVHVIRKAKEPTKQIKPEQLHAAIKAHEQHKEDRAAGRL